MKIKEIIGIDVSKSTIDVCIHTNQLFSEFKNSIKGFDEMLLWIHKKNNISTNDILFVFENTGMYSDALSSFLAKKELSFFMASGLDIKRSVGIARGKDDQVDAKRIALYGYRLKEELKPTKLPETDVLRLKNLFSLRTKLIKQRAGFKASLKEQKAIYSRKDFKLQFEIQKQMIRYLTVKIDKINSEMKCIIDQNTSLKNTYQLITSIKGIGLQTAVIIMAYTDNFNRFENWRKFASYCGIAPFPYQSGTSIKGKTKVSHLANKKLKSIITMCAISAIQHNPEMKRYYQKRVSEGKNRMSTVNIIRNKLIARVFAVVKRQTPYVDTFKFAA